MARSDESALSALLLDYAEAVRTADADLCARLWASDGAWRLRGEQVSGRDAIVERWATIRSEYELVLQLYLATTFEVTGGEATGRSQMIEFDIDRLGRKSIVTGIYEDTFRRTEDGWRFTSRGWTRHHKMSLP